MYSRIMPSTVLAATAFESHVVSCRVVSSGENFSPKKNATECTGTKFYHWGALGGLITLLEEGLYY